jgi:hypothetical protein
VTEEALPIEIDGHTYLFRLEDGDAREIERTISMYVAFHPQNMTYEHAARFLQRGLRKRKDDKLVYIFPQDETGLEPAFQYVKKFCRVFPGITGILVLYGYYNKALIALEWRADPDKKAETATEPTTDQEEAPPSKN